MCAIFGVVGKNNNFLLKKSQSLKFIEGLMIKIFL